MDAARPGAISRFVDWMQEKKGEPNARGEAEKKKCSP